jgi:hypothetical protein
MVGTCPAFGKRREPLARGSNNVAGRRGRACEAARSDRGAAAQRSRRRRAPFRTIRRAEHRAAAAPERPQPIPRRSCSPSAPRWHDEPAAASSAGGEPSTSPGGRRPSTARACASARPGPRRRAGPPGAATGRVLSSASEASGQGHARTQRVRQEQEGAGEPERDRPSRTGAPGSAEAFTDSPDLDPAARGRLSATSAATATKPTTSGAALVACFAGARHPRSAAIRKRPAPRSCVALSRSDMVLCACRRRRPLGVGYGAHRPHQRVLVGRG